jgi:hypothetical protein
MALQPRSVLLTGSLFLKKKTEPAAGHSCQAA